MAFDLIDLKICEKRHFLANFLYKGNICPCLPAQNQNPIGIVAVGEDTHGQVFVLDGPQPRQDGLQFGDVVGGFADITGNFLFMPAISQHHANARGPRVSG